MATPWPPAFFKRNIQHPKVWSEWESLGGIGPRCGIRWTTKTDHGDVGIVEFLVGPEKKLR